MKIDSPKVLRIGAYVAHTYKSDRDRFSGILRYFRDHPDPKTIIIDLIPYGRRTQVNKGDICRNIDGALILGTHISLDCLGNVPYVAERDCSLDDAEIGLTAANLFMRQGYCNFAYVGNNAELESLHSKARLNAFARTVAKGGFSCAAHIFNVKRNSSHELVRLSRFLQAQPKPCAVMAYSDYIAKFVYDACSLVSLSIPDQVGVIGVDNEISICENMRPSLTSILPDFEKYGYIAAEMLMQKILNLHKPLNERPYGVHTVFERESSMDIDGSARLVTQARKYIASHYPEQMSVTSVAKRLGTCRRRLELKFRMVTGGTVREEIERTRLNNARRLLANTNLSIGEIAVASGYGSEAGFRLAFGKAEHMSPRAYRATSTAKQ